MAKITFLKTLSNSQGNPCVGYGLCVLVRHHTCFVLKVVWWPHTPHCNHLNSKWGGQGGPTVSQLIIQPLGMEFWHYKHCKHISNLKMA